MMDNDLISRDDALKAVNLVLFKAPLKFQIPTMETWVECKDALENLPNMKKVRK